MPKGVLGKTSHPLADPGPWWPCDLSGRLGGPLAPPAAVADDAAAEVAAGATREEVERADRARVGCRQPPCACKLIRMSLRKVWQVAGCRQPPCPPYTQPTHPNEYGINGQVLADDGHLARLARTSRGLWTVAVGRAGSCK